MNKAGRQAGFTLLELLVALTLLSLIALVMIGGLRFGARTWARTEKAGDSADSVDAVQNLIRRQLSQIYPQWQGADAGQILFDGNPQSVAFLASPPLQFGPGAHRRYWLSSTPQGDLDLAWQSTGTPDHAALLHGVSSVQFDYFGPDPATHDLRWSNTWLDRARLPMLIRVRVTFPRGDERIWPELVVRPDIRVDVNCTYNAKTQGCRGRPE